MNLNLGSTNPFKVEAVRETIRGYDFLRESSVVPVAVDPGVSPQPLSLEETMQGAINRAKNAYHDCAFAIGLQDGIMPIPFTVTGYMEKVCCAVYDGKRVYVGISSGFEYPAEVIQLILDKGMEARDAVKAADLRKETDQGIDDIALLTKGRLSYKGLARQAIMSALVLMARDYRKS